MAIFEVLGEHPGTAARLGRLTTLHSTVQTPVFMPVGTRGTVRTQPLEWLTRLGPEIILSNTYHLLLSPGPATLERVGGLHRWMRWPKGILTDSGGFQIFSLAAERAMAESGATFRLPHGKKIHLSPESSIAMQRAIGSDIMMVLDQCIDSTSPRAAVEDAMALTHRWAARSLHARGESPQALFAIVQGACEPDLRRQSADALLTIDAEATRGFDGFAVGGLAVGESKAEREDMTELACGLLPRAKPRYLMGVGTPLDLLEGVHRGVDMFDCVLPTSLAQQGVAFTSVGRVDLRRGVHASSELPLDPACACPACEGYGRSYLHHLVRCQEPLGWQLLAYHNLHFYLELMREIRSALARGEFGAFYQTQRVALAQTDQLAPHGPAPIKKSRGPAALGQFRVVTSTAGHASIAHVASGEVMHSVSEPNDEAHRIYIAQSRQLAAATEPLVVWDVGLGAGHNAMALLRAWERGEVKAPVRLYSIERDLDALRLVLARLRDFAHVRHEAPHRLLQAGAFERPGFGWYLCEGEFATVRPTLPPPSVIWYDPFSPKVDTPLWSYAAFAALAEACTDPVELFTYSNSTAVRAGLLAAGFAVGAGCATGPKADTTIAWRLPAGHPGFGHEALGPTWLARWTRSTAPWPQDVAAWDAPRREALAARLRALPQFAQTA